MGKLLLSGIVAVGTFVANFGSVACLFIIADEPECPKALIK